MLVKKENGIPVKRFCSGYLKQANEKAKESYISYNLKCITTYLPFESKIKRIENLIKTTCFEPERNDKGEITFGSVYKKDSIVQDMLYFLMIVDIYTNIEIEYGNDKNKLSDQYDMIMKSGLFSIILSVIPKNELTEFGRMRQQYNDDTYNNYICPQNYLANQVERFATISSTLLSPAIEKFAEAINGIDENKLNKILEKLKIISK